MLYLNLWRLLYIERAEQAVLARKREENVENQKDCWEGKSPQDGQRIKCLLPLHFFSFVAS